MATLWIREYATVASAPRDTGMIDTTLQAAEEPAVNDQTVTFTTTTQSAAFNASTRFITIVGSAAFHYAVGTNPTATTGALKIPADTPWTIAVTAGDKIAAVAAS